MVHNLFNIMNNTTNNGNLEIIRVPQSRLLKREMADYAEMTIGIVQKHDHQTSMFNLLYNDLFAKKRYIEILRLDYGIDSERFKIYRRKSKLKLNISAFKLKLRLLSKDNPDMDLHPLDNAINKHLRYLDRAKNDKELTQKVAGFMDVVENNEEVQEIITELDMLEDVMIIQAVLKEFVEAVEKRISLLAKRPSIKTQALTRGLATSIENLHKAIEVAYLLSLSADGDVDPDAADTVDYETLIGELNELNASYNRSITIRMHNNRRKAEQKEKEGGEPTEGEEGNIENDGADEDYAEEDELEMQAMGLYYDDAMDDELEGELSEELGHNLDGGADE